MNRVLLRIKEKILIKIHKPYMEARVQRLKSEGMTVGINCKIFTDLTLSEPFLVSIGNNVTISTNCSLITHDNSVIKYINGATDIVGRIEIGDNCFIGANSIILPGVSLAKGTIIAAGAVVVKSVKECNQVLAGNPAIVVNNTSVLEEKYRDCCFDFTGMDKEERKRKIFQNGNKLIMRPNIVLKK